MLACAWDLQYVGVLATANVLKWKIGLCRIRNHNLSLLMHEDLQDTSVKDAESSDAVTGPHRLA